ncbi:MAG: hypothetical protein A2Y03_00280 [Omnitrophica WOR_2 bacterium GWF2_38_59]|nr:MAG: hypothetical protein A2Y03_00280 [Omnitrophica WOR_2 bacterium GWF2_38_59]OGX47706.1 MAG: hypothetical protein A2243_00170 [Omnitrophica WOR_2 bacterium RIFOXYA2_FULL_38_17]OGX51403.1 MAG: hypothetical protein A2267_07465 [Omnitrophica WOR_2 bacterium RIFOXYA12_FULL_38_10]OGX56677.1 MAG: hypothetical protein A2306_08485 [Omnitrophica WOR_2 bacterium RIFOXYB2_FULL_38_16]OGX57763.1 MAG: hypothetical protein A2447_06680 [Omnitrophica WOR_2 bacterium RIFOXYC2_FULL_38_12]HBG60415.1 hypothet
MKRNLMLLIGALLVLGAMTSMVFAEPGQGMSKMMHEGKGMSNMMHRAEGMPKMMMDESNEMSMEDMFFKRVKMIYSDQEELGVTEEQLGKIKEVKTALKKDLIMKEAELDIVMVDMMALMYDDETHGDKMKELIDKKYEVKKEKAKRVVDACMSLKEILTEEQKEKMKEMKKGMKKGHMSK